MEAAIEEWNKENVSVVVHLGDIIDGQDTRVSTECTVLTIKHIQNSCFSPTERSRA